MVWADRRGHTKGLAELLCCLRVGSKQVGEHLLIGGKLFSTHVSRNGRLGLVAAAGQLVLQGLYLVLPGLSCSFTVVSPGVNISQS